MSTEYLPFIMRMEHGTIQRDLHFIQVAAIFSRLKWFVTHREKLEEVDFVDEEL